MHVLLIVFTSWLIFIDRYNFYLKKARGVLLSNNLFYWIMKFLLIWLKKKTGARSSKLMLLISYKYS